jgi:ATP-dependent Clp protease ATP-binding subunit ClpX
MAITRAGKICAFCGTPGGPGTDLPLIGGLGGGQVCVNCVDEFHAIAHDEERMAVARRAVPWETMSDEEALATLPLILAVAEQNMVFAQEWVDLLRERRVSWAEIGRTLGVSRQAAWERFARKSGDAGSAV